MPLDRKFEITDARSGAALPVRVVTQAARTELVGIQDDGSVKIRLTAPGAGDPAANQELIGFLADLLGVPPARLAVVAGEQGRDKIVSIDGMSSSDVERILLGQGD
jgi:uncharacterized protein (TIGR00251 family)